MHQLVLTRRNVLPISQNQSRHNTEKHCKVKTIKFHFISIDHDLFQHIAVMHYTDTNRLELKMDKHNCLQHHFPASQKSAAAWYAPICQYPCPLVTTHQQQHILYTLWKTMPLNLHLNNTMVIITTDQYIHTMSR
jgi:hypothetical protein